MNETIIGVYKITNLITNKVYIGQSIDIYRRWQEHKTNKKGAIYQDYIQYGDNNFSFEIIEKCSKEQLLNKERFWIEYYDSYKNGYNRNAGGATSYIEPKPIYVYTQNGEYLRSYTSANEASKDYGVTADTIHIRCRKPLAFNGVQFLYEKKDKVNRVESAKEYGRSIKQYDLEDNYITTYSSMADLLKANPEFTASTIYAYLEKRKHGSCYGYRWCYEGEDLEKFEKKYKTTQIAQYDLSGKLIKIYNSQMEAAKELNISNKNINSALQGKTKTSGGYYWSYANETPVFNPPQKKEKIILQYDLNDNFIKEYNSLKEAAKANGISVSSITNVARGRRQTVGGYKWKYKNS